MGNFIESTAGASKGGFQGIQKIRGLLVDLKLVPPPESWDSKKWQLQGILEDAHILRMAEGEEEFELKDNKYSFMISYAEGKLEGDQWVGKRPHANSGYIKCFVASAEKLGKKPSDFIGQYVTLEKIHTVLFEQPKIDPKTKKPVLNDEGKKVMEEVATDNTFCFVVDDAEGSPSVDDYIRDLVVGLNQQAALRKLLTDSKAKQYGKYKDACKAGTLAEMVGLTVDDKGLFQKKES